MRHRILKTFKGSQDGRFTEEFQQGTEADLTPYLAAIAVGEGWAEPVVEDDVEPPAEKPARAKKSKGAEAE